MIDSRTSMEGCKIDFTKSFLCQSDDKNYLQDPSKCLKSTVYQPYQTLALNIIELKNLNQLHFDIDVEAFQLFEGGLEKVLEDNKAIWHKKCRNKVDSQKVARAKKKYSAECSVASPVKTRGLSLPIDSMITGDKALLRRITNVDLIALDAHCHLLCLANYTKRLNI